MQEEIPLIIERRKLLPKPNYQYEKRRREIEKKKKKAEKKRLKEERKANKQRENTVATEGD